MSDKMKVQGIGLKRLLLSLGAIFLLIMSFSSCRKDENRMKGQNAILEASENRLFSATDVKLPFGTYLPNYAEVHIRDNTIYIYSIIAHDVLMLSLDPLGKKLGSIKTAPSDSLCVGKEGNIWLLNAKFERDEHGNENAQFELTEIGSDGVIKRSSDISYLYSNYYLIPNKILIDDNGFMHIVSHSRSGNSLVLLDTKKDLKTEQAIICILNGGSDIARLSTGEIIVSNRTDIEYELKFVDIEKRGWGRSWSLETPFSRI